jgi:iron complex transport system substrate-binding protein
MYMKKIFICLILFAAAVSVSGCGHKSVSSDGNKTYKYTDDYGSVVDVPEHPQRIVSLSPAVTEIMFALDADSLLVGRTEFCLYPPEAATIENIGGISNLNIEKVLSVNPDLIITGSMVPQKVVEQFAKMGVPLVCVIEKQKFSGLFENIGKIGHLAGCDGQADSLNKRLESQLAEVHPVAVDADVERPDCYYVVGFGSGGNFTAGGNTFINDIIRMAGGRNIAENSEGWTFSLEALVDADPDFILIRAEDSARFCNTSPYNQLSAVRKGRLIALEDGILDLQVPRNIELLRRLKSRFETQ